MAESGKARNLFLEALHAELGAKFVPFAGWNMPVQFEAGVMAEHLWTRQNAGLFDVSHMCQVSLPKGSDEALEALVPVDVLGLGEGRQRYGYFTNESGGLIDDLMIARGPDGLFLVVNAGCRDKDLAHLNAHITGVEEITDRALLALQGPKAEIALASLVPEAAQMRFMDSQRHIWNGQELWISRSGYTGEDGYEISVPSDIADEFARRLLDHEAVKPIGLGARDSLRMEAGLPLYGQDLSDEISPVEAGQSWAISKIRRAEGARAGGFPGSDIIFDHLANGAPRRRVGLAPEGKAPMRAGVELFASAEAETPIGQVTSGGFGPSIGGPIAIGLVDKSQPKNEPLYGQLRSKRLLVNEVKLPFITPGYKR